MTFSEEEEGEVTTIAFGGQGIIRHEGMVVFVPFTAVGDRVRFRIIQQKKNFAIGELVDIVHPSPQRVKPLCPYYGTCGGCQLQHLSYETQLEIKRGWVQDALQRQAGLHGIVVPPVVPSPHQWAYRRRISLTLKPLHTHLRAGYITIDNTSLLEVTQCPIFVPQNDPIVRIVQKIASQLTTIKDNDGKVTILKTDDGPYLLHFHFKAMPKNAEDVLKQAKEQHGVLSGILATSPHHSMHFGEVETALNMDGMTFEYSPKAFIQSNPDQSQRIYEEICRIAQEQEKGPILDLYCGIGISSLLLAKRGFSVTGVEANSDAIRMASANAKRNDVHGVEFICANVEERLQALLIKKKLRLAIVNPPREGLNPVVVRILKENPIPNLIYVSCMPTTLARDLKSLCGDVFSLKSIQAYDMFPQTTHLETLVHLKKTIN